MSPLHLLWIVPLAASLGFFLAALLSCVSNSRPPQEIRNVRGGR